MSRLPLNLSNDDVRHVSFKAAVKYRSLRNNALVFAQLGWEQTCSAQLSAPQWSLASDKLDWITNICTVLSIEARRNVTVSRRFSQTARADGSEQWLHQKGGAITQIIATVCLGKARAMMSCGPLIYVHTKLHWENGQFSISIFCNQTKKSYKV